jgi:uncharacterized protein
MKLALLLRLTALPLVLFAASPALAELPAAPSAALDAATAAAPEPKGPAMWMVADEDTTIYLFGTFHFLPAELEWFSPDIAAALDGADLVVKELGPESEDPAVVQNGIITYGLLPQSQSLSALLTETQNAQLAVQLAALEPQLGANGISPAIMDRMRPWFAFLTLTVAKFSQMGYGAQSGVEAVIGAKSAGKPTIGLERIDEQFGFFAALSQERQIELLMETVTGMDTMEDALPQMADAWKSGNIDALAAMLNDGFGDPEVAERIIYQRNANWAEWIDQRLDQPGTVFIAVGAGHLGGDRSVQDYLARKGITVARVK